MNEFKILSTDISVYPTAHRQSGATVYNPEAKLNTEYNVTNSVAQILGDGHKCFVVEYDESNVNNKILKLCMNGYQFKIENAQKFLNIGNEELWAVLKTSNRGLEGSDYKDLFELYGGSSEDLDTSTDASSSEFTALFFVDEDPTSSNSPIGSAYLKVWENYSNVPEASFLKFNSSDIDGYSLYPEGSELHTKLDKAIEDNYVKRVTSRDNAVVIFNGAQGLIKNSNVFINNGKVYVTNNSDDALIVAGSITACKNLQISSSEESEGFGKLMFDDESFGTVNLTATTPTSNEIQIKLPAESGTLVETSDSNTLTSGKLIVGDGNKKIKAISNLTYDTSINKLSVGGNCDINGDLDVTKITVVPSNASNINKYRIRANIVTGNDTYDIKLPQESGTLALGKIRAVDKKMKDITEGLFHKIIRVVYEFDETSKYELFRLSYRPDTGLTGYYIIENLWAIVEGDTWVTVYYLDYEVEYINLV